MAQSNPSANTHRAADASVTLVHKVVFFDHQKDRFKQIEFSGIVNPSTLNIPFRSGEYGMASIRCSGFTANGHLNDCKVKVEPDGIGYESAALTLAKTLKVSREYLDSLNQPIRFIGIHAKFINSDIEAARGPCWPTVCIPVPLPPPPPPSLPSDVPEIENSTMMSVQENRIGQ